MPLSFSKFFKKQPGDTNQSASPTGSVSETTTTQVTSANASPTVVQPVSYTGIGNPPAMEIPNQGPATTTVVRTHNTTNVDPTSAASPAPSYGSSQSSGVTAKPSSAIDMNKRVGMDVLSRLTQRTNQALIQAVAKVKELKLPYVDTEHVLWALIHDSSIYQLLSECHATPSEIQQALEKTFKPGNVPGQPHFSPRVKRVLELSLSAARSLGYEFISPEHVLLALSREGEGLAAQTLNKFHVTADVLSQKITGKKEGEADEEKKKSALDEYTEDLTAKASRGELDPVVGRAWEIERIIHILSRRTKNNPVLIGDAGVGKTAIVEGLAERIAKGDVPETLLHKRILGLDLMSLIAGARHRGEFEERLKNLIKEVKASGGGIILFIDELHNMVGAGSGGEGTMDASNILKPSLARGELQTIGTTTVTEYRKYIEKDPALERRFQPVLVSEPTAEVAIEMLMAIRDKYEAFHRVKITDESIDAAVRLSQRYIGDRFLPDKAVDLIDEAAASVRLPSISLPEEIKSGEDHLKKLIHEKEEAQKAGDKVRLDGIEREIEDLNKSLATLRESYQVKKSTSTDSVSPDIIAEIVSRWTGIPVSRLTESESVKLLDLENIIHKRLIDQEDAVKAVAEAVRRGRAGLKSNKRPIGSFIFMGPTGVGKTELAKTLAENLFGSEDMMVRLDMTEYMEKHEVAKLIGAPPGYVGYEEGGQLTEAVRRKPYSVVLFDEIEKAHPDVFNILIQLLDDGRLTDNKGHTISFKNTIVICTSNLGSGIIQEEMLKVKEDMDKGETGDNVGDGTAINRGETAKTSSGKVLDAYAISPTGREIIAKDNRYWEKDSSSQAWKSATLADYFAGSIVKDIETTQFPDKMIDTQLIAPDGSETITYKDLVWFRTATTAKEWTVSTLLDYLKGHTVINALPDKPEEQLPAAKLETHSLSPMGEETMTVGNRFWRRINAQVKEWSTGMLAEYFQGQTIQKNAPDKPTGTLIRSDENQEFPTEKWDIHVFRPTGEEIIIAADQYWKRTSTAEQVWTSGSLIALFPVTDGVDKNIAFPVSAAVSNEETPKTSDPRFEKLIKRLMEELRKFFRPELINRFDEVVVFRPLTRAHMAKIVDIQVKGLGKQLKEQNIGLTVSDEARLFLAKAGFDPVFGARPLRRTIQRMVENPVSSLLIKGEVTAGDTIVIACDGFQLSFEIKKMKTPQASETQISPDTLPVDKTASNQTTGTDASANPSSIPAATDQKSGVKNENAKPSAPNPVNPLADYFDPQTEEPKANPPTASDTPPSPQPPAGATV